ncbi:unnamed protein product [Blepharisma stoltei]|uniref:FYVE-type domain-containing protein n=1 Tax=Blepharisma stoltei TaxID=1481888 RepID=A0AAU9K2Z3_9CILI|nr:unnamed protein product [Blepharisma stoltei]
MSSPSPSPPKAINQCYMCGLALKKKASGFACESCGKLVCDVHSKKKKENKRICDNCDISSKCNEYRNSTSDRIKEMEDELNGVKKHSRSFIHEIAELDNKIILMTKGLDKKKEEFKSKEDGIQEVINEEKRSNEERLRAIKNLDEAIDTMKESEKDIENKYSKLDKEADEIQEKLKKVLEEIEFLENSLNKKKSDAEKCLRWDSVEKLICKKCTEIFEAPPDRRSVLMRDDKAGPAISGCKTICVSF